MAGHILQLKEFFLIMQCSDFIQIVQDTFMIDAGRDDMSADLALEEAAELALKKLSTETKEYGDEYEKFVGAMSYAPDEERINFGQALSSFTNIAQAVS